MIKRIKKHIKSYSEQIYKFSYLYRKPLIIFTSSRILVLLSFYLGSSYGLGAKIFQWDANGYLSIAKYGYVFDGKYTGEGSYIGLFPLYPFIVKAVSMFSTMDVSISSVAVSFVCGLFASVILYKLIKEWGGEESAITGVFLFSFFPMSVFLSSAYTESLFFLITLSTFYSLKKRKYQSATVFTSLAMITRPTGFILLPILLFEIFKQKKSLIDPILYGLVVVIPFYIFLLFQYIQYKNPFAFLTVQKVNWFHKTVPPWEGLADFLRYVPSDIMYRVDLFFLILMIITLLVSFKKMDKGLIFFSFGVIVISFCETFVLGLSRYLMAVFPFYFFWGKFLTKYSLFKEIIFIFFGSWLAINTILFIYSLHIF